MVTAIVIPIIFLYFFWITKKEIKEQENKWLKAGQVSQEAMVIGKIISIHNEKQKFYYNRYIFVQVLKLQTETKLITVLKETPITKNFKIESFQAGEIIRVYGQWKDHQFYCGEINKINK